MITGQRHSYSRYSLRRDVIQRIPGRWIVEIAAPNHSIYSHEIGRTIEHGQADCRIVGPYRSDDSDKRSAGDIEGEEALTHDTKDLLSVQPTGAWVVLDRACKRSRANYRSPQCNWSSAARDVGVRIVRAGGREERHRH